MCCLIHSPHGADLTNREEPKASNKQMAARQCRASCRLTVQPTCDASDIQAGAAGVGAHILAVPHHAPRDVNCRQQWHAEQA